MTQILTSFMIPFLGLSMAATFYNVGDYAGWTIIGNVDYNQWASSKTFQVDDTLVFNYDPQYHNVLQVSRPDFHSCDATAKGVRRLMSGCPCQFSPLVTETPDKGPQVLAAAAWPASIGRQMLGPFSDRGRSMLLDTFVLLLISFLLWFLF